MPQQTLFALNSDFIQDRAAALAELSAVAQSDAVRVRVLYRRAFCRDPKHEELQTALDYVRSGEENTDRWQQLAHVLLAANEFVFVD